LRCGRIGKIHFVKQQALVPQARRTALQRHYRAAAVQQMPCYCLPNARACAGDYRYAFHDYSSSPVASRRLYKENPSDTPPITCNNTVLRDVLQRGESDMARRLISSGSTFEQEIAYSRAVVDGEWVFVSGTTGFDYLSMTISDDLAEQTEQCLKNIEAALHSAGASLRDVVRVTYILPKASEFPECWPILRKYFGEIRPAATMISAGLVDPRMRIEIEVTARASTAR
jgi:enamine deaminase RidA (YjgF/YER057c/UK114 family)